MNRLPKGHGKRKHLLYILLYYSSTFLNTMTLFHMEAYSNRDSSANLGTRRGIVKISETFSEKGVKVFG